MESNVEETELEEWRDQQIWELQSSLLERQAQMRRVGQEEGDRKIKDYKIFKMAHMSLQLSPYHFMKVSYAKRSLKCNKNSNWN